MKDPYTMTNEEWAEEIKKQMSVEYPEILNRYEEGYVAKRIFYKGKVITVGRYSHFVTVFHAKRALIKEDLLRYVGRLEDECKMKKEDAQQIVVKYLDELIESGVIEIR